MEKVKRTHYAYDNEDIQKLLNTKSNCLPNEYTESQLVSVVIGIFLNDYIFMDHIHHVLKNNYEYDEVNSEIENIIFNIIASHTELKLHDLKENELVSDIIKIENGILAVYIHDLETDEKIAYKLVKYERL